ncbi:MAG: hypothetical protein U5Q03_12365 [Bacteroidota bacterium]|nr:hypothetical protein [Bacteroidota bacterium]
MDWFVIFIVYLVLSIAVCAEGSNRQIGGFRAFLASVFLTPLVGAILVMFSKKKISFHHFVKLHHDDVQDKSLKKSLHTNGKDHWVEIKTSELNIL